MFLQKLNLRLALLAAASLVSASAIAQPDDGVLISRTTNKEWQIRLISSAQPLQFNATVESSQPFLSATPSQTDGVDIDTSQTLRTILAAWPGHTDGVTFAAAPGSELCLRDSGRTGVKVYLGDTFDEAVPISLPFSLAGADACGTGSTATMNATSSPSVTAVSSTSANTTSNTSSPTLSTTTDASPAAAADAMAASDATVGTDLVNTAAVNRGGGRKFHPGHYVAMVRNASSQSLMTASIKPGVKGIQKRYTWRELEPTLGSYNFTEIASDLNWAKAHGMRLIVMIEDKTFKLERPTPSYLDKYTPRNRAGGYTLVRWNSYVVQRMNALTKALGSRFDSNPYLEGIALQETSLGLGDATLNAFAYTPEKYRDAYISMLSAAANNLPTSRVFWYMNFFVRNQDYIGAIANAVAGKGVLMGGPDVLPDNSSLRTKTYPFYDKFYGRMNLFGQVEDICYRALHMTSGYRTKYWTMPELFGYARDKLHTDYMFWVRIPHASPADSYDWYDTHPVVSNNPAF
jgi:hypothetical protein